VQNAKFAGKIITQDEFTVYLSVDKSIIILHTLLFIDSFDQQETKESPCLSKIFCFFPAHVWHIYDAL